MKKLYLNGLCIMLALAATACSQGTSSLRVDGDDIAATAGYYVSNEATDEEKTQWAQDKAIDNFPEGTYKCNKFVYDMLRFAGATAPVFDSRGKNVIDGKIYDSDLYPIRANTWARTGYIPDWAHKGKNVRYQSGDVIAMLDSSGNPNQHVGIAFDNNAVIYTSPDEVKKFRFKYWAVRRYTGS